MTTAARVHGSRSNRSAPFRRSMELAAAPGDDGSIRFVFSTEAPVRMRAEDGEFLEVLDHSPGAMSVDGATALLLNHDPNRIVGTLSGAAVDGERKGVASATLLPGARMDSGVAVIDAVKSGALRGVSVGYDYSMADTTWDRATRTLRVMKWRVLENSLTPIPADVGAGLRSIASIRAQHPEESSTMKFSAWLKARGIDAATLNRDALVALRQAWKADHKDAAAADNDVPDPQPAAEKPADDAGLVRSIVARCRAAGLDAADYIDCKSLDEAQEKMIGALAEKARATKPDPTKIITPATVTMDHADKVRDAAIAAYAGRINGQKVEDGNPFKGCGLLDLGKRFAKRTLGIDVSEWNRRDEANFVLGDLRQVRGMRDAANIVVASFPSFVMLDAITKITARGIESSVQPVYSRISSVQRAPDFKTVRIGGMGTANLVETAENLAFPELIKSEGVFNSTAKMWGGTLSLSLQALISDDTGQFERSLSRANAILDATKDKRAIQKFLRGTATTDASTWTNNTSSGCTIVYSSADTIAAARANLYRASIGMMNKVGMDGNPLGHVPRILLCGPTNAIFANGLQGPAGGAVVANSGQLETVVSPYLELSTITGNSTTSYYLLADPNLVDGLIHLIISGYESIQVQEYDAGAVGSRKWKLWCPFEFDLFSVTNPNGTAIIPGAQQATT